LEEKQMKRLALLFLLAFTLPAFPMGQRQPAMTDWPKDTCDLRPYQSIGNPSDSGITWINRKPLNKPQSAWQAEGCEQEWKRLVWDTDHSLSDSLVDYCPKCDTRRFNKLQPKAEYVWAMYPYQKGYGGQLFELEYREWEPYPFVYLSESFFRYYQHWYGEKLVKAETVYVISDSLESLWAAFIRGQIKCPECFQEFDFIVGVIGGLILGLLIGRIGRKRWH